MAGKITTAFAIFTVAMFLAMFENANCNPAIAMGYDPMEVCIENCAQCKKTYGPWFDGQLCAESCLKFKGKLIPDCDDFGSISAFVNRL